MVTGGGSGGHIYPIIAVVTELQLEAAKQNIDLEVRYLGSAGMYKKLLEDNNLKVSGILLSKIRRYKFWSNFLEIPKFIFSLFQALWGVYWFMPDVLFSKGGPGSVPVVLAASFYRIPIVIHESDSVPGLSNKLAGKHAKVIAISYAGVAKYFPANQKNQQIVLTGNLIRRSLFTNIQFTREQYKRRLGFDPAKPLIFIYGGSQGSQRINNFIIKNLPLILEVGQVYHQTGKENYNEVLNAAIGALAAVPEGLKSSYKAVPYLNSDAEVQAAYIASDLVISRAGGQIFEIGGFGRPSILIPLPESAQDHQRTNAYEYEAAGAGVVIEEDNLATNLFLNKVIEILSNKEKTDKMIEAAKAFYKPDAALNLAKIILSFRDETK